MRNVFLFLLLTTIFIDANAQKSESFVDPRDRKSYKVVEYRVAPGPGGVQKWMAENLSTDRFRNGDIIPQARTPEEWKQAGMLGQPAWCYYENNPSLGVKYGKLYNWYAVNDPRGLAPEGWHVATDEDWSGISEVFNKTEQAGRLIKSKDGWSTYQAKVYVLKDCRFCFEGRILNRRGKIDICGWCSGQGSVEVPETNTYYGNGTDSTAFNGQPAGFRHFDEPDEDFLGRSFSGNWWTTTEVDSRNAWCRSVYNDKIYISREEVLKELGLSVRCVRMKSPEEELIAGYFTSSGGLAKWQSLQGFKMNAILSRVSPKTSITIIQLKDGRQATVASVEGKEIKTGMYDGQNLWSTDFMTYKAEKLDSESNENFKINLADFPSPLIDYERRGYKVSYSGYDFVGRVKCFRLLLDKKPLTIDGKPVDNYSVYYFDVDTYLPVMVESVIEFGESKGLIRQLRLDDYREVGGLLFPFSITQGIKDGPSQTISVSFIELNPKTGPELFAFPMER